MPDSKGHGNCRAFYPLGAQCSHCPLLPSLALVSRLIHDEVTSLVYGENQFVLVADVSAASGQDLTLLHQLRPSSASKMRQLQVVIDDRKLQGIEGMPDRDPSQNLNSGCREASESSDKHQIYTRAEKTLKELAELLVAWGSGPELDLHIMLGKSEWRKELQECILALRPLRNCGLSWLRPLRARCKICGDHCQCPPCLSPQRIKEIKQVVSRTINSCSSPMEMRRFMEFPTELRLQILTYTGLDLSHFQRDCLSNEVYVDQGGMDIIKERICCKKCSLNSHVLSALISCACPSAKSGYSTTCTCPQFPSGLFQASKLLNEEATLTFFPRARFTLSVDITTGSGWDQPMGFLKGLSKRAVRLIRMIEIAVDEEWLEHVGKSSDASWGGWPELVNYIATHCDLPQLSLSFRGYILQYAGYLASARMIKAMKPLRGKVKCFRAFVDDSFDDERLAEKYIMGPNYEPCLGCKLHPERKKPKRKPRSDVDEARQMDDIIEVYASH